jgi:sugar phosphate isomerase/epimerase
MDRVLSTHVVVNHRLTTAWLSRIEKAGIAGVEIFCAPQHIDVRDKTHIADLGHWFRDSPMRLHSIHAPMYTDDVWGRSGPHSHINIASRVKADRMNAVGEIKRALEIAETVPFSFMIQHIGAGGQEYSDEAVEAAFTSLEELSVFARQRGVRILLENIPNELSTAERLETFNRTTHLNLDYVFDTGHAHIGAGIEHEFEIMKPRIRSLHVHDNDGTDDSHLFPLAGGAGTIDWNRTMELLRSCPGQFPLLLELREVADMRNPVEEIARVFDRLEALEPANA